ncbi:hypothetical protein CVT25_003498 [Psilocybe cyanescens]|uniref:Uncharacterized protein n=1 Tax=Psilocybe cyanescens TaxID=93625 RepID=A0A409X4Q6_PSICY|nr:hypothetical protein CVT25_003498 [Psilocybe cyanescens]
MHIADLIAKWALNIVDDIEKAAQKNRKVAADVMEGGCMVITFPATIHIMLITIRCTSSTRPATTLVALISSKTKWQPFKADS